MTDPIEYLLNAMEHAAQSNDPFANNYGAKRRAVLDAIKQLRAELADAVRARDEMRERCAAMCDEMSRAWKADAHTDRAVQHDFAWTADACAAAIRALAHPAPDSVDDSPNLHRKEVDGSGDLHKRARALVADALRGARSDDHEWLHDQYLRAADALLKSPAFLAAMAAERDEAYQRGYTDGVMHAAPPIYQTGSAGEAVCERCEGVGVVPVNGHNRFCPDCNPEGRGPKVEPTLYMLVGKDGHREARVFYNCNADCLADFDMMRPANAPHRFVPLYTHPALLLAVEEMKS